MRFRAFLLLSAPILVALRTLDAPAQQQPGVAVQLPTFSFFNTNTTVSVPDRGSVYMGGVKRASTGVNEFGVPLLPFRPFRNRSIGQETGSVGTSVSVYIHNFEEMEEALLGGPPSSVAAMTPRSSGGNRVGLESLRAGVAPRAAPAAPAPRMETIAGVRAERAQQKMTREQEAADFYGRGQTAEAAGKLNLAKIYYQMAAKRATGSFKAEVLARLEVVKTPGTRLAQGTRTP